MASLTENLILQKTKVGDLSLVKNLNLWGSDLDDVSLVSKLPNLEVLALSVNKVTSLKDIAECKSLRELYLRKNDITSLGEAFYLSKLPNLTVLWLCDNPCASHPMYRLFTVRCCTKLKQLDNVEVSPQERSQAERLTTAQINDIISGAKGPQRVLTPQLVAQPQQPPAPQQPQAGAPQSGVAPSHEAPPPRRGSAQPPEGDAPRHGRRATGDPPSSQGSRQTQKAMLAAIITLMSELSSESLELLSSEVATRLRQRKGHAPDPSPAVLPPSH